MDDAGFIIGSYVIALGAMLIFAVVTLRRSREAARLVRDRDKPWL